MVTNKQIIVSVLYIVNLGITLLAKVYDKLKIVSERYNIYVNLSTCGIEK